MTEQMTQLAKQARGAARELARLTTAQKNASLLAMAEALEQNAHRIREANALDMEAGASNGLSAAMLDRLRLDDKHIAGMARGLRDVAALPDPIGKILDDRVRPNGLRLQKITTPIGDRGPSAINPSESAHGAKTTTCSALSPRATSRISSKRRAIPSIAARFRWKSR